jgi:hypothetical protein
VQYFESRGAARQAEADAIVTEVPRFNIRGSGKPLPRPAALPERPKIKILTARRVETAKLKAKGYGIPDGVVPGLRLFVEPSGKKTFTLHFRLNNRQINYNIGSAETMTLAQAREAARDTVRLDYHQNPFSVIRALSRTDLERLPWHLML